MRHRDNAASIRLASANGGGAHGWRRHPPVPTLPSRWGRRKTGGLRLMCGAHMAVKGGGGGKQAGGLERVDGPREWAD
jgi:hypothetical protein